MSACKANCLPDLNIAKFVDIFHYDCQVCGKVNWTKGRWVTLYRCLLRFQHRVLLIALDYSAFPKRTDAYGGLQNFPIRFVFPWLVLLVKWGNSVRTWSRNPAQKSIQRNQKL